HTTRFTFRQSATSDTASNQRSGDRLRIHEVQNSESVPGSLVDSPKMNRRHHAYPLWGAACVVSTTLAAWISFAQQAPQPNANALKNAAQSKEWLTYGGNYAETRFSPLKQIDPSNVSRLGLAWTAVIGTGGGNQEATPLFSNGVLY